MVGSLEKPTGDTGESPLDERGLYDEAKEVLDKIDKIDPDSPNSWQEREELFKQFVDLNNGVKGEFYNSLRYSGNLEISSQLEELEKLGFEAFLSAAEKEFAESDLFRAYQYLQNADRLRRDAEHFFESKINDDQLQRMKTLTGDLIERNWLPSAPSDFNYLVIQKAEGAANQKINNLLAEANARLSKGDYKETQGTLGGVKDFGERVNGRNWNDWNDYPNGRRYGRKFILPRETVDFYNSIDVKSEKGLRIEEFEREEGKPWPVIIGRIEEKLRNDLEVFNDCIQRHDFGNAEELSTGIQNFLNDKFGSRWFDYLEDDKLAKELHPSLLRRRVEKIRDSVGNVKEVPPEEELEEEPGEDIGDMIKEVEEGEEPIAVGDVILKKQEKRGVPSEKKKKKKKKRKKK